MILALGVFLPEVKPVMDNMLVLESGEILGRHYCRGVIGNNEVIACGGFVGKVETSMITQKMIDLFNPRLSVLTSGAAAIDESIEIGDVVVGTEFEEYDTIFPLSEGKMVMKAPDTLLMRFLRVYFKAGKFGKILSGDGVIANSSLRDSIHSSYGGIALDMDSAPFAKTAFENKKNYLVLKTILDRADETSKRDFDRNYERLAGRSAELLVEIMKNHYIDRE
ncbi:MAG TPA: adenosylhomocysteine nucleosidase [Mesotoga infera]|jgi:adenosylhomocysteine nucleosidase|uniref:Adenosylhomocysteine nucleosidase n=1 Tax=Mesotoga infera TaxID=1236046 RepID=A0A101GYN9_9BACT|nr:MAG: Nucleoside phosphorylase [Mesotoga infera]KUK89982.1 MAG: Nucleoside phosphorylase [Mesotoga infera]HCO70370.1 adenosylhomocysteine nucleosidase [Mesotoga infera]